MTFIMANRVEDVLRAAFDDEFPGMAQATSSKLQQTGDQRFYRKTNKDSAYDVWFQNHWDKVKLQYPGH